MLRRLYASLLRCRLSQEHAGERWPGRYDLAIGEEAIVAGATADLDQHDSVVAPRRDLASKAVRERHFPQLFAAASNACPDAICRSLPDDAFNRATGIALACKLDKKQRVVVAFCSDPATPLSGWHDALKIAATQRLPIIYVVKNASASAGYAPHLEAVSFMTRKLGFPGIIVDGQDVVAVWRVAHESILRARAGSGPTLIDCRTEPSRDPLAYMQHYMRSRKAWDDDWKSRSEAEIRDELQRA